MRWLLLLCLIFAAHVALWLSDLDSGAKLRLTLFNAAGWAIVLGPIWLVGRWLRAVEKGNEDAQNSGN
jgi:hypothetical protein